MQFHVTGAGTPVLAIDLAAGEKVYSQTSAMCWMSETIAMDAHSGAGFFITEFTAKSAGQVCFAPRFPGAIIALTLRDGESLICRKEAFLCAQKTVSLEIAWRPGAGLFGGEGFILQKVTGPGVVWLELSGGVMEKDLAPGEKLLVNAGHLAVQTTGVDFDIQRVSGVGDIPFGGEGQFLATLTGPGHLWLQSMPILNLAAPIGRDPPVAGEGLGGAGTAATIAASAAAGVVAGAVLGSAASADVASVADDAISAVGDVVSSVADVATGVVGGFFDLFGSDDKTAS